MTLAYRLRRWAWATALALAAACSLAARVSAQPIPYFPEWFNPAQAYLKIFVNPHPAQFTIVRLAADSVFAYVPTLRDVPASELKLYFRGTEVPLYVSGGGDPARFDSGDFIEFYGERNDGFQDSMLYRNPATGVHDPNGLPNKRYSRYSRESVYFLTHSGGPGQRYAAANGTDTDGLTPETRYRTEAYREFLNNYYVGGLSNSDFETTLNSDYSPGEGITGSFLLAQSSTNLAVSTVRRVVAGQEQSPPRMVARVVRTNPIDHVMRITVAGQVYDFAASGTGVSEHVVNLTQGQLTNGNTSIFFSPIGTGNDVQCVSSISILYDRDFTYAGDRSAELRQWTPVGPGDRYLRFTGMDFASASDSGIVYDLTNRRRITGRAVLAPTGNATRDDLHVRMPNPGGTARLLVSALSAMHVPARLEAARFGNLRNPNQGAELLIVTPPQNEASALEYAAYRDTSSVNRRSTVVVPLDVILNEFGYGLQHPLPVKQFFRYVRDNWTRRPRFILLWDDMRAQPVNGGTRSENTIQSYGVPPSDILLLTGNDQSSNSFDPWAAIGRVSVLNNTEGMAYLNKVRAYEQAPFDDWMKRGLHLGGGETQGEQNLIRFYLEQEMEPDFEGAPLQGNVFYYQKNTSEPVQASAGNRVREVIDSGVVMIAFYGHSATNIFDIAIEEPAVYANFGKPPFILANGCYSGDFTQGSTFGERFVKEPVKGAIGYAAMTGQGDLFFLGSFSDFIYNTLLRDSIRAPIGNVFHYVRREFANQAPGNKRFLVHSQQFTLQCDPTVRLRFPQAPDLVATEGSILLTPAQPDANADSFQVCIVLRNRGLATSTPFAYELTHTVVNTGRVTRFAGTHTLSGGSDTLCFTIQRLNLPFEGLHTFSLRLDDPNAVAEFDETNNSALRSITLVSDLPALLYPWPFAQLNRDTLSLQVGRFGMSTEANVGYFVEVDTVPTFDSPMPESVKHSGLLTGSGTATGWRVPFNLVPGQVYYWRARLASSGADRWTGASFRYVPSQPEGWQQSQPPQFQDGPLDQLQFNTATRRWAFPPLTSRITINHAAPRNKRIFLNAGSIAELGFISGLEYGITYCVFDGTTLAPKTPFTAGYGNLVTLSTTATGTLNTAPLEAVLNGMSNGDYILIYATQQSRVAWSTSAADGIFAALQQIGVSTTLRTIANNTPFILIGQKRLSPQPAFERYWSNPATPQDVQYDMTTTGFYGSWLPQPVGPASGWSEFAYDFREPNGNAANDFLDIRLYGLRANGTDSLVYRYRGKNFQATVPLTSLNASRFPRTRVEAFIADSTTRTPLQPTQWRVLYSPATDLAIDPSADYAFQSPEIDDGAPMSVQVRVRNLSPVAVMDTFRVQFGVQPAGQANQVRGSVAVAPLPAWGSQLVQFGFNTSGLDGDYFLNMEANPEPGLPERNRFNNHYAQPFKARGDGLNPLLDVTFDGRHLINGDVVSPQPLIVAELKDENPNLILDDTSHIDLFFKPAGSPGPGTRLSYATGQLNFVPASGSGNRARVEYRPVEPMPNGEYQLNVQGYDKRRNAAGTEPYSITFRVVNESSISHVINYPNPFSTSTRFVYTLTGLDVPDVFQIHIYTITGKLVKVVDLKALGEVRPGTNLTDYAWDGTDEFGDKLANGVYLYRVVMRMPGNKEVPLDDTHTAKYFKNGWGKMYILR